MKKVLVISTSLRENSNSEELAHEFAKGAQEAGHQVEELSLRGKEVAFCRGCLACQQTQKCVISDDAAEIAAKMLRADVLAFATPIYYYEMSGQMKTLLDRSNPLFPSDYQFREVYLLTAAADEDEHAMDRTVSGLEGWIACFGKARLAGIVRGVGLTEAGAAKTKHQLLQSARELGQKI